MNERYKKWIETGDNRIKKSIYMKAWRKANVEHMHEYSLKTRDHRLARNRIWESGYRRRVFAKHQGLTTVPSKIGNCAICGIYTNELHIDHNHLTGRYRDTLCGKCNRGIGMFNDSSSVLNKASAYLIKHSGQDRFTQIWIS